MAELSYVLPEIGLGDVTQDPLIRTALSNTLNWAKGKVGEANFEAAVASTYLPGLVQKSIIATEQVRTNTAFGVLGTPDEVTLTMPENGLIAIAYQATWKESVGKAARAAIFIGANQLLTANNPAPAVQETVERAGAAETFNVLATAAGGLAHYDSSTGYTGDATTGQLVGSTGTAFGPCVIFAAAGSYKISVQFKASSGNVTVKSRKLWAWVVI